MSSSKRWKFKNPFSSSCGCRPTATDNSETSSSDQKRHHCASSTVSSTSTTFSPYTDKDNSPHMISPCPKINDSLAVVKDSDDPYRDFRQSMLQMISEKEIYSRSDLQQLLRCFLDLNPPYHHEIIVRAFMDLWNGGSEERTPPCSA